MRKHLPGLIEFQGVTMLNASGPTFPESSLPNFIDPQCYHTGMGYLGNTLHGMIHVDTMFRKADDPPWIWHKQGATEEALDNVWAMTGRWQARRGAPVDRDEFDSMVVRQVRELAEFFNQESFYSLQAFDSQDEDMASVILKRIIAAVVAVSSVKKTQKISPMFGSKVLHHYFPSIVPVFDTAYVSRMMRESRFANAFINDGADGGWLDLLPLDEGWGSVIEKYALYLAICSSQVAEAEDSTLDQARKVFAQASEISSVGVPDDSPLWRLDARIVEKCVLTCDLLP